jgi:hypothetical protein
MTLKISDLEAGMIIYNCNNHPLFVDEVTLKRVILKSAYGTSYEREIYELHDEVESKYNLKQWTTLEMFKRKVLESKDSRFVIKDSCNEVVFNSISKEELVALLDHAIAIDSGESGLFRQLVKAASFEISNNKV